MSRKVSVIEDLDGKKIVLSFYGKKTPTSKVGDELRLLPT